jgi:putative flippase GtrA
MISKRLLPNPKGLVLSGAACAGLNILLVAFFEATGSHYLIAAGLAFPFVLVAGYLLHARLTFAEPPSWASFLPYAGAMALNLPASAILLVVFCEMLGLSAWLAVMVITAVLTLWNLVSPLLAFAVARTCLPKPLRPASDRS